MAAYSTAAAPRCSPPERAGTSALVGWMLFDWATQPFYTLVVTFLFAPYFVNGFMDDPARGSSLWAYATGIAELIAAAIAPVLGSIVDGGLPRKPWIAGFSVLLAGGMCGLWFAAPGQIDMLPLVLISFGIATIGAELATVFTNAMMPSLVGDGSLGKLSGFGWAIGYLGGLVSLALLLGLVIPDPQTGKTVTGLQPILALDTATREGDRLVGPFSGLWYLAFVVPLFLFTPDRPAKARCSDVENAGFAKLASLVKDLVRNHTQIALFLAARMLYADGLGAVFALAASMPARCSVGARPNSACSASSSSSPARSARCSAACSTIRAARNGSS